MENRITVACVFWKGHFTAPKYKNNRYTEMWVEKMRNMVARNMTVPYEFVCLSNIPFKMKGVKVIPLKYNLPGWWSKLELFRNDLPIGRGRVLYLDLDLVILSSLDPFINFEGDIAICDSFVDNTDAKDPGIRRGYNSSVISYNYPVTLPIWDTFIKRKEHWMEQCRGDQDYLKTTFREFEKFPRKWIKKLGQCLNKKDKHLVLPEGVKIILCMFAQYKNLRAASRYRLIRELWK